MVSERSVGPWKIKFKIGMCTKVAVSSVIDDGHKLVEGRSCVQAFDVLSQVLWQRQLGICYLYGSWVEWLLPLMVLHDGIWKECWPMFRLSRDGCTSLSVASILTRPFTILYIKTSLALCLLSSNVGHFSSKHLQESKQHHELLKTKPKYQKCKHKREGLQVIG
jgi:hypothetical protein